MTPTNPYESPRGAEIDPDGATPYESQRDARIADLEMRVWELEKRIGHTRLVSHSFYSRAFAVFGHWLAAYSVFCVIGLIVYAVMIGLAIWAFRDAFP
jgi:hypothetical protein